MSDDVRVSPEAPVPEADPSARPTVFRRLVALALDLALALAAVTGSVAGLRRLVVPGVATALDLEAGTTSVLRRVAIFAAVVLSYAAFVRLRERRSPRELALRPGWILLAGAAGAASIGITILILLVAGRYELVSLRGWGPSLGVLAAIAIAATAEEVVFRGILFRLVEARFGVGAALAGSAAPFGLLHLDNHGARWITLASVTLMGLMWAGVFVVSRNLWVTAAHHASWNATIFVFGLPLSGSEDWRARAPFETVAHGSELWTGGAFGPEDSWINLALTAAVCAVLWWIAGRRRRAAVEAATPRTATVAAPR